MIVGGKGRDHLGGGWGSDTIYGGAGNDVLDLDVQDIHDVPPFQDVCYGGGGNDTFKIMGYLSAGDGVIDGGSGVDTIDARDLGDVSQFTVTNVEVIIGDKMYRSVALTAQTLSSVTLLDLGVAPTDWVTSMTVQAVGGGVFDVQGKLKDTSIGVRLVGGDTYDFTLLATEKNDLLQAGSGHDVMYGRGGDDIFYTSQLVNVNNPDEASGNGGDDAFHSFENGEHLFGGNGNDTFYNPGCIADGGSGYDVVNVSSVLKDGSYTNMEALIATGAVLSATAAALGQFSVIQCLELDNFQADLYVTGSERFDLSGSLQGYRFSAPWTLSGLNFKASNFADHMTLSQFADDVDAAGGNDYVLGGDGDDTVSGGAGDDRLVGGTGSDNLAGGTGNDTFYYEQLYAQPDVITDFVTGEDTLALDFALAWGAIPMDLVLSEASFSSLQPLTSPSRATSASYMIRTMAGSTSILTATSLLSIPSWSQPSPTCQPWRRVISTCSDRRCGTNGQLRLALLLRDVRALSQGWMIRRSASPARCASSHRPSPLRQTPKTASSNPDCGAP